MTRAFVLLFVSCALMTGVAHAQSANAGSAERCAQLSSLQIPGIALAITKAQWIPAGPAATTPNAPASAPLPAYCRVDGMIDRRQGTGGRSFGIGFAVSLPDAWSGRLLMQGGGGLNGTVAAPLGGQAAGNMSALARGFAVVTTDTGHQSTNGFDGAFMADQQAMLDFEFVAIGRVAALAKDIVARYYSKPADHSYFAGCSTGGREAMLMTQRYPTYFDGVIAGAPAMRTGHSNLALRSMQIGFNQIAPRDASGKPLTAQAFSDSDRKLIVDSVVNTCDATDGVKDGMIFDRGSCKFEPQTLVCKGAKADGCLSSQQAAAVANAFAGPKDSKGNQVYPGFYYDSGIAATGGLPGVLAPGAGPPFGPIVDLQQDIDREARAADTNAGAIVGDTWSWTNLNTFSSRGGKLLFYHGVSDPWFSAQDTVDYYTRLGAANGGADAVRTWSRLFLSPGMGHCGGGPAALDSFDMLTALVDWVEKGTAPNAVTATGRAFPGRSRPLCAYPQHAQYKGQGDPQDAANFECKE